MSPAYMIVDVFTDTPLQGNQLSVPEDGSALSDDQLQRLAPEMNHSGQLPAMGLQSGETAQMVAPGVAGSIRVIG